MEPDKLLQAQAELVGLLRDPIRDAAALLRAKAALSTHCAFITHLSRVAGRRMGMPLETIFQCLMQMSAVSDAPPADFDHQHRDGAVPMHQAKVLRRDSAREVEPLLRDAVKGTDEWNLPMLIAHSVSLRTLLRIKVEDGNDLSMARRAITQADDYMTTIFNLANGDALRMWGIFSAMDERELAVAVGRPIVGGGPGSNNDGSSDVATTSRPLPKDLARGIEDECRDGLAGGAAVPVGTRQRSLADIDAWLRQRGPLPDGEARAVFAAPSFRAGMHYHLAEKRSALLRAACDVLSLLLARCSPAALASEEAVAALTAWAGQLMTQVHVTVAAIATATDCAMRDIIVATGGACVQVVQVVASAMARAAQPELHRKALGYGALALAAGSGAGPHGQHGGVARPFTATRAGAAVLDAVMSMLPKGLGSSTEAVRRNARVAGLVVQMLSPQGSVVTMPPQWDARVEKAAAPLVAVVEAALNSRTAAAFETEALLYSAACPIALILSGRAPAPAPMAAASSATVSPAVVAPPPVMPILADFSPDAAAPAAAPIRQVIGHTTVSQRGVAPAAASAAAVPPRRVPFDRAAVMGMRGLPVGGIPLGAATTFEPAIPSTQASARETAPTQTTHGGGATSSGHPLNHNGSVSGGVIRPGYQQTLGHGGAGSLTRSSPSQHNGGGGSASLTPLSSPSMTSPRPQQPPSASAVVRHQPLGPSHSQSRQPERSPPQHLVPTPPGCGASAVGVGSTSPNSIMARGTAAAAGSTALRRGSSSSGSGSSKRNTLAEVGGTGGDWNGGVCAPSQCCDSSERILYATDGDAAASPSVASASAASSHPSTGGAPFSASRSLGGTMRGVPLSLASLEDAAVVAAPPASTSAATRPAVAGSTGLSGSLRRRLQQNQP